MIQPNPVSPIRNLADNIIFDTDSYKLSHWTQYPDNTTRMMSYLEARGGEFPTATLFGLQYLLHRYLSVPVTYQQVDDAYNFALAHGEPFNEAGWRHIVKKHNGYMPVRIRAIAEGLVVPTGNCLLTIESTDPEVFWIASYLETMLVRLWEGSTVATTSRESKKIIKKYLDRTSDNADAELSFKLHDFGARGVTSKEQARIAGAAHLCSFMGSDTIEGIRMANHYYHEDMAGFSIPASEHSTVTMWGRDREMEMVETYIDRMLVNRQLPPGVPKLASCVADSYDAYEFTRAVSSGRLKDKIKNSGGTFVIRPDSGHPLEVLPTLFSILLKNLSEDITTNSKGYRVLPDYMRVIQGDGIDIKSMTVILGFLTSQGWSAANIAFGSGGGLLQKWNRDTQKWKLACCSATVNGKFVDVQKDPVTDKSKRSKAGRLDLLQNADGSYETVKLNDLQLSHPRSVMGTVYEDGKILSDTTLAKIRARMAL